MNDEIDAVSKISDATQEVAKTTGKAIDAISGAAKFFESVFGDLVVDGVGLVRDRLKFYRLERAALLAVRTQARLEGNGINDVRPVPPKIALPLIEAASLENDDGLHLLWANLLASAMSEDAPHIEKMYVSILGELSPDDAWTLSSLYYDWRSRVTGLMNNNTIRYGEGVEGTPIYNAKSVINIARLGLIAPSYVEFDTYVPETHDDRYGSVGPSSDKVKAYGNLDYVILTEVGEAFCKAVDIENHKAS